MLEVGRALPSRGSRGGRGRGRGGGFPQRGRALPQRGGRGFARGQGGVAPRGRGSKAMPANRKLALINPQSFVFAQFNVSFRVLFTQFNVFFRVLFTQFNVFFRVLFAQFNVFFRGFLFALEIENFYAQPPAALSNSQYDAPPRMPGKQRQQLYDELPPEIGMVESGNLIFLC